MESLAAAASMIAVCRIAWAESMAALSRRVREHPSDLAVIDQVRERLRNDWSDYAIIEVTQPLVELAGEYADTFALRGYDSVQLAAASLLRQAAQEELRFACFDDRLRKAAEILGMRCGCSRFDVETARPGSGRPGFIDRYSWTRIAMISDFHLQLCPGSNSQFEPDRFVFSARKAVPA